MSLRFAGECARIIQLNRSWMYAHSSIPQSPIKIFQWKFWGRDRGYEVLSTWRSVAGPQYRRSAAGVRISRSTEQNHRNKQGNAAVRSPFSCTWNGVTWHVTEMTSILHFVIHDEYPPFCNTEHTQTNGAVLIVNTIKTAPFFCVYLVHDEYPPLCNTHENVSLARECFGDFVSSRNGRNVECCLHMMFSFYIYLFRQDGQSEICRQLSTVVGVLQMYV